ncbi:MAG TPA: TniB family NTP-binding protein [Thermosynechococcaceae cyanobacterium]
MENGNDLDDGVRQLLIERLQKRSIVELEQVQRFHEWLDGKRLSRQACRVIGDSRTGKTLSCEAYQLKHPPNLSGGSPPLMPIVYWQAAPESSNRDLFAGLLDGLQYQITRGTLSELRERVYRLLKACQVEMLIVDEAHRLRPKALSELQDILDKLQLAIVLVGTDRLNAVIRRDEQVERRFIASHHYDRLSAAQLIETSAIWETHVLKLPQASHLSSVKVQKLLAPATGGYIGLLDRILREAAVRSLRLGQSRIEFKTLSDVIAECQ